jgi:hypothetical protein
MPSSSVDSPTVSNQLPTSLTLTWNDAGSDALDYHVTQWSGTDETGSSTMYTAGESLTINITGLSPGKFYTFAVSSFWSDPGSTPAFGTTPNGTPTTVQMLTGCSIRDGGDWKVAVPYIRESGTWKLASPNVRVASAWKAAV